MNDLKEVLKEILVSNPEAFEFMQSTAVDGMWLWSAVDPNKKWISESMWKTLGFEPSYAQENNLQLEDLVFPEDSEKAAEAAVEHYKNPDTPFRVTIRYNDKNGNTVYLETRGMGLMGADGKPEYMLGITHNITQQIESQRIISKQRDRFRAIIEGSDLGTWEWNVQTGETRFNEKWANIIGYELSELEPTSIDTWVKYSNDDDLKKSNSSLERHFEGKSDFYIAEARMKHKEGHWVWVLDKGKVISWTDDGKPEWMVGSHQDITNKRKMERSLAKAYKDAKTLIEQSPVSIAMFDTEMNYLSASPLWKKENGLENTKFIGQNHYLLSSNIKADWKEIHKRALRGETVSCDSEQYIDSYGDIKWMKWDVRPWKTGADIGGIIIHTQNITQEKLQEQELRKAKELLEKTNEIADIGSWRVDLKKMETFWSPATKRIHETDPDYEGDVESGINFYKEGWSRDKITHVFTESVSTGKPYDEELIIVTAKGNEKWVRAIGIPEMINGKCVYMHGLFIDIDKQKKEQNSIQEIADNYQAVLESIPDRIYVLDRTGEVQAHYGNGSFYDKRTEKIKKSDTLDNIEIEPRSLSKHIRDFGLLKLENQNSFEHNDIESGNWFESKVITEKSGGAIVVVKDISNRKAIEGNLNQMQKLLQRTNEVAEVGSWDIDVKGGGRLIWNDTIRKILEVEPDFEPDNTNTQQFYHANDLAYISKVFEECMVTREKFDIELLHLTAKGNEVWTRLVGYPEFEGDECTRIYGIMQNIDKQKRAKIELELSEKRFRTAFESTALGMVIGDVKGTIIEFNDKFSEMLGYSHDKLKGMSFTEISHIDKVEEEWEELRKIEAGKTDSYSIEKQYVDKNGRLFWVLLVVSAIREEGGNINHLIAQVFDIDEQKAISERLEESERKLSSVFNSTFEFMGFLDKDGNIESINTTALSFAGTDMETVSGLNFADAKWWDLNDSEDKLLRESLLRASKGEFIRYETVVIGGNGEPLTIDFSIKPIFDEDKNVDTLIVEGRPIEDLVRYRDELKETATHLKSILDASTRIAIIESNPEGKIITFNKGAENLLGYSSDEATEKLTVSDLHRKETWNRWVQKLSRDKLKSDEKHSYHNVFASVIRKPEQTFEIEYRRKDGSTFPALVSRTPIKDSEGHPSGVLVVVSDITKLKRAETDLVNLLEITTDQNKRLLNFAHIVSHNLRSHAGNMTMLLDLMITENPSLKENDYLPYLQKAAGGLMDTIQHLNDTAAFTAKTENQLEKLNLSEYVEKNINNLKGQLIEIDAKLDIKINNSLEVKAIPAYLDSIILNLITNCVKYHSPKRVLSVTIQAENQKDYTVLSIEDNGIGIDLEKNGNKIFGLYNTFHNSSEPIESKGIGLFITKNQIESMGGKIEVTSIPDIGSKFKVFFQS